MSFFFLNLVFLKFSLNSICQYFVFPACSVVLLLVFVNLLFVLWKIFYCVFYAFYLYIIYFWVFRLLDLEKFSNFIMWTYFDHVAALHNTKSLVDRLYTLLKNGLRHERLSDRPSANVLFTPWGWLKSIDWARLSSIEESLFKLIISFSRCFQYKECAKVRWRYHEVV